HHPTTPTSTQHTPPITNLHHSPHVFVYFFYPARRDLHSFPTRRSSDLEVAACFRTGEDSRVGGHRAFGIGSPRRSQHDDHHSARSEEHTSELQSRSDIVCRLLLEKKKNMIHSASDHLSIPRTGMT